MLFIMSDDTDYYKHGDIIIITVDDTLFFKFTDWKACFSCMINMMSG